MVCRRHRTEKAQGEEKALTYEIIEKIYSPLSKLTYNLTFRFEDNYPAKMPEDFARDMIYLYSRRGDLVWDGCCGSGTVPRVANRLDRIGYGTDINPEAVDLASRLDPEGTYCVADAREITLPFRPSLIISSLPFGLNIIGDKQTYSDTPGDISHSPDYETFYLNCEKIILNYYRNLAPNGVMVLDARDRLHRGKTYCLILDFLNIARRVGFELVTRFYYELIPYRQMTYKHRPTGHVKAMPATMDVIVMTKLKDCKMESWQ